VNHAAEIILMAFGAALLVLTVIARLFGVVL
jgi:hypothetical protein